MSIGNVTYKSLKDLVVTYIVDNSYNINSTKFNSLPNYFKSGYSKTVYTAPNGSGYTSHIYISITDNIVSLVSNTVDSNITTFLANAGYTNLNANIPTSQFIGYFNNLISFCSRYLRFSTSQFTSTAYLIYGDTGSTASYTGEADDLIRAKSMNDILNILQNRLNIVIKCYPVRYTYTFD